MPRARHTTGLALWGLAYAAVPVTFQTWILRAASDHPEAASSIYVSMFNLVVFKRGTNGDVCIPAVMA